MKSIQALSRPSTPAASVTFTWMRAVWPAWKAVRTEKESSSSGVPSRSSPVAGAPGKPVASASTTAPRKSEGVAALWPVLSTCRGPLLASSVA